MRIITYILTMLLLLACENNDGVNDIPFETITADKTISLSSEEHAPSCRVHLKLESATSKAGHIGELINETVIKKFLDPHGEKDMKIAAEKFISTYTDNYKKTMKPLYSQDRNDASKPEGYR